jgi:hypothetical protein
MKTKLGTFYNASGIANVQPRVPPGRGGILVPQIAGQETDVYFFGEKNREDRLQEIPDLERRLQHVRTADAALGSVRRHDRPERRPLHAAPQHDPERQGRADVLPAVAVLPTKEEDRATGFLIPT